MKFLKNSIVILVIFIAGSIYADVQKLYVEYEYTPKNSANKMMIKLYKEGDKYKLWRKLSDSPNETGTVTTYIDVQGNSVISVTEKDGVKKGIKSGWDDDYFALVMEYHILFRGVPKGKSFKNFTKSAGTETFEGRDCEVYESGLSFIGASTKYYMWNNVMLKSSAPDYSVTASQINEDPVFTPDEFTVPADVSW